MIKEQPTRDELMMVVRDQANVIDATIATQTAQYEHLIKVAEQRDRAIDTIANLLNAVRKHPNWEKTMLIDASIYFEQAGEWMMLLDTDGDAQ